ncbi:DUF488 domain-containing protein [Candidatus Woesearchaeota archaeon]|nr:DUF488 domain-containing protein [Candidatus Woesearchaeota archaeon]
MALYTKCIHAPYSIDDGIRICVTGRLTEKDGTTPIPEWVQGKSFDIWMPVLAPSPKLVGAWYRNEIEWPEFEQQYRERLDSPNHLRYLSIVLGLALRDTVTLLCVEPTPEKCHRRILAQVLKEKWPELEIIVR